MIPELDYITYIFKIWLRNVWCHVFHKKNDFV